MKKNCKILEIERIFFEKICSYNYSTKSQIFIKLFGLIPR